MKVGRFTSKPENFYTYTVEKKCVLRLSSGVDIEENNTLLTEDDTLLDKDGNPFILTAENLARSYILEGGLIDRTKNLEEMVFTPEIPAQGNVMEQQQFLVDQGYDLGKTGENKDGVDGDWGNKSISASAAHELKIQEERTVDVWKNESMRGGIGLGGAYGDPRIRSDKDEEFGIVPMPGIIDAVIRTKSDNGSLREAQINFRAHNKRQLEVLETLYMRPGYPLLLEWGWSPYISNRKTIEHFPDILEEFFDQKSTEDLITNLVKARKTESGGNYDGFLGFVKNFEFKARPDGGYDCSVDMIGKGEIMESLKSSKTMTPTVGSDGLVELKVEDRFRALLLAIKTTLDTAEDDIYIKLKGTKGERSSMYDSWGEYWREFLWFGDGSTAGDGRNNIENYDEEWLNPLDRELLNRDDATDLRNFNHITNLVAEVLKVSEKDIKEQLKHDATEQEAGYDSLLYGTLLKMNTQRGEIIPDPDRQSDYFAGTGIRKDIYVRWDLICQMWNKLCIPQTKENNSNPITELTYLGNNQKNFSDTIKIGDKAEERVSGLGYGNHFYLEYSLPNTDTRIHDESFVSYHMGAENEAIHPAEILGQSFNPDIVLMPHQDMFRALTGAHSGNKKEQEEYAQKLKNEQLLKRYNYFNELTVEHLGVTMDGVSASFDDDYNIITSSGTPEPLLTPAQIVDNMNNQNLIDNPLQIQIQPPVAVVDNVGGREAKKLQHEIHLQKIHDEEVVPEWLNEVMADYQENGMEVLLTHNEPRFYSLYGGNVDEDILNYDREDMWKNLNRALDEDFRALSPYSDTQFSRTSIGMTYFNLDYLIKKYSEMRLDTNTTEEGITTTKLKEKFSFMDFVNKIWDDVAEATGNYFDFALTTEHERPHVSRIVETTLSGHPPDADTLFKFEPQGLGSISRDFNFSSKISNEFSSTIAIAAQAPKDIASLEAVSFKAFHKNIRNRFTDPSLNDRTVKVLTGEELEQLSNNYKKDASKLDAFAAEAVELRRKMEADVSAYEDLLITLLNYTQEAREYTFTDEDKETKTYGTPFQKARRAASQIEELQNKILARFPLETPDGDPHPKAGQFNPDAKFPRNAIIPLEFAVELDGIAGLLPFQLFRVDPSRLPKDYGDNDVVFIIKGESQKVSAGGDWTTEINGQLTLLDDPSRYDGKNPTVTNPTEEAILYKDNGENTKDNSQSNDLNKEDKKPDDNTMWINPFKEGTKGYNTKLNSPWPQRYSSTSTTPKYHTGMDISCNGGDELVAPTKIKILSINNIGAGKKDLFGNTADGAGCKTKFDANNKPIMNSCGGGFGNHIIAEAIEPHPTAKHTGEGYVGSNQAAMPMEFQPATNKPAKRIMYAHLRDKPIVKTGQTYDAGTVIGYCGTTGQSQGFHLHYEVGTEDAYNSKYWGFKNKSGYQAAVLKNSALRGGTKQQRNEYALINPALVIPT